MIKLLADENIPKETVDLLKGQGADIISVQEFSSGLSDRDICELAKAKGRIVVTFERFWSNHIQREVQITRIDPSQVRPRITATNKQENSAVAGYQNQD